MTNQPCPYTCSNKNSAGYCKSTCCVNYQYNTPSITWNRSLSQEEINQLIDKFNEVPLINSVTPIDCRIVMLKAVLPELKEECNHLQELFDIAWDNNQHQLERTELTIKTTDYLVGIMQTISYLISTLEESIK